MKVPMLRLTVTLMVLAALNGCGTPRTAPLPPGEPVRLLQMHADYGRAVKAAPEWVRSALHVIQDQTGRIKELEVR